MPGSVSHKRDQALWFSKSLQNQFHNIEIYHLAVAAKVVNRSRFALEKRGHNGGAMIGHVDPVAHVHTVAIDRERFVAHRFDDHERNQFFRELVGTVVIRTTSHQQVLAVRLERGERQKIGAGFASRIR